MKRTEQLEAIDKKRRGWAMYLKAYYPVFVGVFEGLEGGRGGPPKNHVLAKMFETEGQKILWHRCTHDAPQILILPTTHKGKK